MTESSSALPLTISPDLDIPNLTFSFRSNSRLSTAKSCMRRYFFAYEKKLIGGKRALPLDFGLAWHKAMDKLWTLYCWEGIKDRETVVRFAHKAFVDEWTALGNPFPVPLELEKEYLPRTPGVALEMLYSYFDTRAQYLDKIVLISVEEPFAVPIDPSDPTKFYVGYLDKVFSEVGRYWVEEHKTTTLYSKTAGFQLRYIEGFDPNSQIDGYGYALKLMYPQHKPMGVIIDAALVHKDHHNIFQFIPINKSAGFANDWLEDTLYWWERIDEAIERGRFPKNDASCQQQFGTCPYRNICAFTPNINQMPSEHPGYIVNERESFPYADAEASIRKALAAAQEG